MTAKEKRAKAVSLIKSIAGRNTYSQSPSRRERVFDTPGYGDCSSTVRLVIAKAGGPKNIGSNTSVQLANHKTRGKVVDETSGIHPDESKLLPGDCLYFKGNTAHTLDVGHVEMYTGKNQCYGHGSGKGPTRKNLRNYCKSRGTAARRYFMAIRWLSGDDGDVETPTVDQDAFDPVIVDLSEHNNLKSTKNDWAKACESVDLFILRCGVTRTETEPLGIGVDHDFAYAAKTLGAFGRRFGVYYYGKVDTVDEAIEEARFAYETASPYNPLFYVYDVEEGAYQTKAVIRAWREEIQRLCGDGTPVGVYVAHSLAARYKAAVLEYDFIWIPRYGKNTGAYDPAYDPAYKCELHQYTSRGSVPGIADKTLDLSRAALMRPGRAELMKRLIEEGKACT